MSNLVLAVTVPDVATFVLAGVISVGGALGVVVMRNPVHSALSLVMTLFGVAVLFVEENAQFLAAVQVIVYAGAIVVLFLFVIMLLGVDQTEALKQDPLKGQRSIALGLGVLVLAEVILLARGKWPVGAHSVSGSLGQAATSNQSTNTYILGKSIFTTYLLPFEITSALLIIAVIGAVVLSRRPQGAAARMEPIEPAEDAADARGLGGGGGGGLGGTDAGDTDAGAGELGATELGATELGATELGATELGAVTSGGSDL